jgi:hypothetical protein
MARLRRWLPISPSAWGHAPGTKLSNATINRYLTAISSVMTYAEQKTYITHAPKLPWRKEAKHMQPTYTHTMQDAVIALCGVTGRRVGLPPRGAGHRRHARERTAQSATGAN